MIKTKVAISGIISIGFLFFSCSRIINPLYQPIKPLDTKIDTTFPLIVSTDGNQILIKPGSDLRVRAVEDCVVLNVVATQDSNYYIFTKGKYFVTYGNLAKCSVNKYDKLNKGQRIGELHNLDYSIMNDLELVITDQDEKKIFPNFLPINK